MIVGVLRGFTDQVDQDIDDEDEEQDTENMTQGQIDQMMRK